MLFDEFPMDLKASLNFDSVVAAVREAETSDDDFEAALKSSIGKRASASSTYLSV